MELNFRDLSEFVDLADVSNMSSRVLLFKGSRNIVF